MLLKDAALRLNDEGEVVQVVFDRQDLEQFRTKPKISKRRGPQTQYDRAEFRNQVRIILRRDFGGEWPRTNTKLKKKFIKWYTKEDEATEDSEEIEPPSDTWFKERFQELKEEYQKKGAI